MLKELQGTVCQIAIFMICAQAIVHFRAKESYAKYLRMLLGVMILVQIFQPFCQIFFGVTGQELSNSVEQFQADLNKSMEKALEHSAHTEQNLETMSLTEVQERLQQQHGEEQERQSVEKIEIKVEVNPK